MAQFSLDFLDNIASQRPLLFRDIHHLIGVALVFHHFIHHRRSLSFFAFNMSYALLSGAFAIILISRGSSLQIFMSI